MLTDHDNLLLLSTRNHPMHYKTITLELLREYPELHQELRTHGMLQPTMERYATQLKQRHLTWMETLAQTRPKRDPIQLSSEALQRALQDLRKALPAASSPNGGAMETPFSLEAAMADLRRHMPPVS